MNVLYIGPYRDQSTQGIASLNHIRSLKNKCTLTIRPIFLTSNRIDKIDSDLELLETKPISDKPYDICIQYAPIDYLVSFRMVSKKNYSIPIIPYSYRSDLKLRYARILDYFDYILCDSQYDIDIIKNIQNNKKKLKLYNYTESLSSSNTPDDLLSYNKQHKFYTFINEQSIRFFNKILIAFFIMQKKAPSSVLFVILENNNYSKIIKNNIDLIVNKMNIKYSNNYIKLLSSINQEANILGIHNVSNCCIYLRDYTNTSLPISIAKLYNNTVITNENIVTVQDIDFESTNQNDDVSIIKYAPTISDLSEKMKNSINVTPIYNIDNIPTIDKLICK